MQFLLSVFQVIVRLRANKHLSSLGEFVTDWRKGKFTREHTSKRLLLLGIFFNLSIRVSALNFSLAACVAAVPFPFPGGDGTRERKSGRAKGHAWGEQKFEEKWVSGEQERGAQISHSPAVSFPLRKVLETSATQANLS